LVFGTARRATEAGLRALQATSAREIQIDCRGISASDSAGLTVLLDWLGAAKKEGRSLHFTNLLPGLLALAHISEVAELLQKGV
jgi:phospholipid transport system transporter-binding protein